MSLRWHILTPELPPGCGGVGDYTAQVAEALARSGDAVTVYSPPAVEGWAAPEGLEVVTLGDRFGTESVRTLSIRLDRDPSSRLLVQYVPAVFGRRGGNETFCRWVRARGQAGTDVRVMFHEPYSYFRWRPDHFFTAVAQRAMARILLDATPVVYLSTDTWRRYLSRYGSDAVRRAVTIPIPSAIARVNCPDKVRATRSRLIGTATHLVGHFGSYGDHVAPMLREALNDLLSSNAHIAAVCTGAGSDSFVEGLLAGRPAFQGRLAGAGRAAARDISLHLQACDLLIQPYPDGVTTRRTSVMAGLANGRAVVTSEGPLTENIWRETGSVRLAPSVGALVTSARGLLTDSVARAALEACASATYASRFDLRHTIEALRSPAPAHV
ncbi:MAG: hypothetical protein M3P13_01185 [Acidobacteriota bacterium]|nr:hypothetical protein [Acidobacteriota bacterium]